MAGLVGVVAAIDEEEVAAEPRRQVAMLDAVGDYRTYRRRS
jgi:hypothetical protein